MKKSIIALVIAGLPLAASAEVILYGQIKSSVTVGQVKIKGDAGSETSSTATSINDNTSRIGFKGSENLGGDLKAIWQVEQKTAITGGSQGFATRDSFIGLQGNFGKIRAGKLSNMLNEMDTIDPWMYKTNAAGLGIFTRTGNRNAAVRYDSPDFGGFKFNVSYAPRDNRNPSDKYTHTQAAKDQYIGGVSFSKNGFTANAAYGHYNGAYTDKSSKAKAAQIAKVETYYDKDNLFVGGGVQYAKGHETANKYLGYFTDDFNQYKGSDITTDTGKEEAVKVVDAAVTVGYKFGNVTPRITYAHGWPAKGVNSGEKLVDKFDQVVIGGQYTFSKRTGINAQLAYLKVGNKTRLTAANKGGVEQKAASVGLYHKF